MTALRRHNDIRDMLAALLVAATMRATLALLLHHLVEEGTIFGFVAMRAAAMLSVTSIEAVLGVMTINRTALLSAGMSSLQMRCALVESIGSDMTVGLEAVILFSRLMRIIFLVNSTALGIVDAAACDVVRALLHDMVVSVLVEEVVGHRHHPSHSLQNRKTRSQAWRHYRMSPSFCISGRSE